MKAQELMKVKMKQWYETLFENYGQKYDSESFTQGTIGECDFICWQSAKWDTL
jgi:hypothetical protein